MKAMPSTSLQVGVTPKLLDGGKADLIICVPDEDALGEDYLTTMWHASKELLEFGGVLLPAALQVFVMPVDVTALYDK